LLPPLFSVDSDLIVRYLDLNQVISFFRGYSYGNHHPRRIGARAPRPPLPIQQDFPHRIFPDPVIIAYFDRIRVIFRIMIPWLVGPTAVHHRGFRQCGLKPNLPPQFQWLTLSRTPLNCRFFQSINTCLALQF
jgi:hypothetical protein